MNDDYECLAWDDPLFDDVDATKVVIRNTKLYINREEGFIGTSLRKDEYVCDCSDIDDIIVFTKDGKMMITKVGSKTFIGKNIMHVAVFKKKDKRTIYNMIYKDGKGGPSYIKRFAVRGVTRDKEYDLTTETYNSVVSLTGIFPWQKFRVDLEDTFQLDKITDVYLKSFSLIGPTSMDKCLFFVLDIEEFNLRSYSNNPHLKSKIVIQNTISGAPTVDTVFTKSYSKY